jgi:hypothetical protein
MTKVALLQAFKAYTEEVEKDVILPVAPQKNDKQEDPKSRAVEVHIGRLPDTASSTKKAPYILHQIVNSKTVQEEGSLPETLCVVRSVFCVYNKDAETGMLSLIELMERLRISVLTDIYLADQFELDRDSGLEDLVYPNDTAPYFMGEMLSVWRLPRVKREVTKYWMT